MPFFVYSPTPKTITDMLILRVFTKVLRLGSLLALVPGTETLINRLIETGKSFDMMAYPNRTHGIYEGAGTTLHVYSLLTRYLMDHVPAGGR